MTIHRPAAGSRFDDYNGGKAMRVLSRTKRSLLDLVFPPRCHICGRQKCVPHLSTICASCLEQLPFIESPLCLRCGCPFEESAGKNDRYCSDCLKKSPLFETARALVKYHSAVPDILYRLKYKGDSSVIGTIRAILEVSGPVGQGRACQLIVPVPLHTKRLRQRGSNQSLLLARLAFSAYQEKIAANLLVRPKNTASQTGLSGTERRRNLKNAFQVRDQSLVAGASVLLVDDVFTTGATVSECSKTLIKNGAERIHVWTFARV